MRVSALRQLSETTTAFGLLKKAVGVSEIAGEASARAAFGLEPPYGARSVFFHQVALVGEGSIRG